MPLISFSHPWYLLLGPLLIWGAVYLARRSLADLQGRRAVWSLGLRIGLICLAVLALAGLQSSQPAKRLAVLFVLDQSDSVPPDKKRLALEYLNRAAKKMGRDDEAGAIVFGSDAYVELDTRRTLSLRQVHSVPGRDYSNLAGAVRLALAAFPENTQRRVVLLSDGNENIGNAIQESASAAAARVQVDVVPISYQYAKEVLLEKMTVPGEAKVGEPFEVRIVARSTYKTGATIRLLRNGELIAQQSVDLLAGANVITFQQSLDKARFHTYEAIIETREDQLAENNRALGFVLVRGKPRVLIVDSNPSDSRFLAAALQGQQLEVDIRPPGQLPANLAEFQTYDSVVLSNVPAYQLTPDQMKAIRSSVRDLGAGLVMIGGEHSFGPGAYRNTPIEEALPVDMEVKKHKVMPVGAVAMVLHTCEFPDGNRWAAETAAAVVDVLGERDKVGVIIFDTGERWGIPMQPAANKAKLKSEIYTLNPGDAPDFQALMKVGYDGLTTDAKEAAVKHMIVISDGDPQAPTPQLLASIRKARITVSSVAVFPHSGGTERLELIAREGKGQFYNVKRPEEIPRIFLKEAQRVLKPAIIEETFVPHMLRDSQLLSGITSVPPLMGYVAATPKQAPGVEVALASKHDDPVLASWRFGLGKAVAFTSDAKNRWAAPWLSSGSTFARFWAQTIRWTVRSTARAALDTQVELDQRKGRVVIDVLDAQGNFVNGLDIHGSVAGEKSSPRLRINQTAPGRYEGEFEAGEKGQYMVGLQYADREGTPRIHTVGAAIPYSPEYRNLVANSAVLTALAERTGGKVYPNLDPQPHDNDLRRHWRHDRTAHTAPQDLWPALVLLAALLLPVDIGVRRLMLGRSEWIAIRDRTYELTLGRIAPGRSEVARARDEGMGRLLAVKSGASRRDNAPSGSPYPETPAATETTDRPVTGRRPFAGAPSQLPEVPGARPVAPAPADSRSAATRVPVAATLSEHLTAAVPGPAAASPSAPPAPAPTTVPAQPRQAQAPQSQPSVIWNRTVPGVTPTGDAGKGRSDASAPAPPAPDTAPADDDAGTSRLLRAKRRARDRQG